MTAPIPSVGSRPADAAPGDRKAATPVQELESVTIRFAATPATACSWPAPSSPTPPPSSATTSRTLPDFPAEIRAPAGTLAGVSGFQVHFSSHDIHTPGDKLDTPGRHEPRRPQDQPEGPCRPGGILDRQLRCLRQPATCTRPATRPTRWKTARSRATACSGSRSTSSTARPSPSSSSAPREADRCKNFFALGLVYWLYERSLDPTLQLDHATSSARTRPCSRPTRARSRPATTTAKPPRRCRSITACPRPSIQPGTYRKITGNEALAHRPGRRRALGQHAAGLCQLSRSRRPATSCTTCPS